MKIAPDKRGHFWLGMLCAPLGAAASCAIVEDPGRAIIAGLLTSVAVGIGKEIYDYFHRDRHTPEFADAAFTALGGAVVSAVIAIIALLIHNPGT